MPDSPKAPEWRDGVSELQGLHEKLAQSLERLQAILELPTVDAADHTWDSLQGLAELTRVRDFAADLARAAEDQMARVQAAGEGASAAERQRAYSLGKLSELIARMINTSESRRSYTYVPPYDIEKTLRAFMRLRDEASGEIRILEDRDDKVA